MSIFDWIVVGLFGLLCLYITARLVSAAIFRSKLDYEERKRNGT